MRRASECLAQHVFILVLNARRADDSEFGLAATVWGPDLARADRIARRLDAGTIWVNQWLQLHPLMAFGGHKVRVIGSSVCEMAC